MASVAVARFGGAFRSSGAAAARAIRTVAGPSALAARSGLVSGQVKNSTRCMSTMYTKSHEYLIQDGDTAKVGITDFAAKALGDVVFVDLPDVGDEVEAGEPFGSVESVKAASDVYAPVAGEVLEVNEVLKDSPDILNDDPMGDGWFMKIKVTGDMSDSIMDREAYEAYCIEED